MKTIDDYCDIAKQRHGLKSDRILADALNINSSAISQWRTKRTWPSDTTMIHLAELAGIDKTEALVELGAWKNYGLPAYPTYETLLKIVQKTAAIIALVIMSNIGFVNDKALAASMLHSYFPVDSLSDFRGPIQQKVIGSPRLTPARTPRP